MKMMRFMRILPCFSSSDADDFEPTMKSIKKVSNELGAALSLRTAALVLILVIVEPFLAYTVNDFSVKAWIVNMKIQGKSNLTTYDDIDYIGGKMRKFYAPKDSRLISVFFLSFSQLVFLFFYVL
jgi:hypothetical protein